MEVSFHEIDLSLAGLHKFLSSTTGRDKVGKTVHYGARGIAGFAGERMKHLPEGSIEYRVAESVHRYAHALFVRLMNARRTVRWLTGIPYFLALRSLIYSGKAPWRNRSLFFLSQFGMFWWTTLDHIRWLQEIGWISGDSKAMKRFSFRGYVLASLANVCWFSIQLLASRNETENDDVSKQSKIRLNLAKHLLTLISVFHISELMVTRESICGLSGMLAACIDVYLLYPRLDARPGS